ARYKYRPATLARTSPPVSTGTPASVGLSVPGVIWSQKFSCNSPSMPTGSTWDCPAANEAMAANAIARRMDVRQGRTSSEVPSVFENILAIVADFRHVHGANDPHVAREPKDHITAETHSPLSGRRENIQSS